MDRQHRAHVGAARAIERRIHGRGRQIEADGINVRQYRNRAGAENGADRGKKAERRCHDGLAVTHTGRGQRQPQGIGARRAPQRMGDAQLVRGGLLECGNLIAKNKLLRREHPAERLQ